MALTPVTDVASDVAHAGSQGADRSAVHLIREPRPQCYPHME